MQSIIEKLKGGDRRSLGKAHEVAAEVLARPRLFKVLINGMLHQDPVVAMQALADLARQDAGLRNGVIRKITALTTSGSPAVKSRGKKLLAQMKDIGEKNKKVKGSTVHG